MTESIFIAGREIRSGFPPYIVAEIAGNHGGSIGRAKQLIDFANYSGADAVKTQTFLPNRMTFDPELRKAYARIATPMEWHKELMEYAANAGITLFSSVFDPADVQFQFDLGAPALKIASPEILRHDLIAAAAQTNLPVIISTGMANVIEISSALEVYNRNRNDSPILMHCVSGYPPPSSDLNMLSMGPAAARHNAIPGFSDHTMTPDAGILATALGAAMIERHIRAGVEGDEGFASSAQAFGEFTESCRRAWQALGDTMKPGPMRSEDATFTQRPSIYLGTAKSRGATITEGEVVARRPGRGGVPPIELKNIVGRQVCRDLRAGQLFSWDMLVPKE